MPAVSFVLHLHHPFVPAELLHSTWANSPALIEEKSTEASLHQASKRLFDPVAKALAKAASAGKGSLAVGATLSGDLLEQWQTWRPESLELWKNLSDAGVVQWLTQPRHRVPEVLWDREAWQRGIQAYQMMMADARMDLAPILWQPGYLFNPFLAWPLKQLGLAAVLADGDAMDWRGSWSHRIGQVAFQSDLDLLVRDTGWSESWLTTWVGEQIGPAQLAASWEANLAACPDQPVILAWDLEDWLRHPGVLPHLISGFQQLLTSGQQNTDLDWVAPSQLLEHYPIREGISGDHWWVAGTEAGLLANPDSHPIASELQTHWRGLSLPEKPMDPRLLDASFLRAVDDPAAWYGEPIGSAGHLYGRLIRSLALAELERRK